MSLMALVVLSACNSKAPSEDIATMTTEVVVQEAVMEKEEPLPPVTGIESRFGDSMSCSMLSEKEAQEECEAQVNNFIGGFLMTEIMQSFDGARCKELPGQAGADCEAALAAAGVKGPVSDEERALFREITRGTFPELDEGNAGAIQSPEYDASRCAELKATGYKEYCEKDIARSVDRDLLNEIFVSQDSNRCAELKDEDAERQCNDFFGLNQPELAQPEPIQEVEVEVVPDEATEEPQV